MSLLSLRRSSPVLAAFAALVVVAACSDDGMPPSADPGTISPPPNTGATDGGGGGGADADADASEEEVIGPALCEGLEQKSQDVVEYAVMSPPPTPTGGTIAAGTYVLNELTLFDSNAPDASDPPPPGPTGNVVRSTLYVTGKTIRVLESRGTLDADLPADSARASTYQTATTTLETTAVCPQASEPAGVPFSVDGLLLTLHVDATRVEVYRLLK